MEQDHRTQDCSASRPHGGAKAAIELDYGNGTGPLILETRAALAFYVIKNLNLDLEGIAPERKQIVLSNLAEPESAQRSAREQMRARGAYQAGCGVIRGRPTMDRPSRERDPR